MLLLLKYGDINSLIGSSYWIFLLDVEMYYES